MRKSYGHERSKIPSALADPYDNKQQKASNMLFSFPYRDKHFTQKRAAPIPAFCLCYLLSYSTCLSLKFGNEEGDTWCSTTRCWLLGAGRKGQSFYTPMSPQAMRKHQWVACISLWLWGVQSKLSHLPWAQHLDGVLGVTHVRCCVMEGSGPNACVPGVTEQCWTRTLKV